MKLVHGNQFKLGSWCAYVDMFGTILTFRFEDEIVAVAAPNGSHKSIKS